MNVVLKQRDRVTTKLEGHINEVSSHLQANKPISVQKHKIKIMNNYPMFVFQTTMSQTESQDGKVSLITRT